MMKDNHDAVKTGTAAEVVPPAGVEAELRACLDEHIRNPAEKALADRFWGLFYLVSDALMVIDPRRMVVSCGNTAAAIALGYPPQELNGMSLPTLFPRQTARLRKFFMRATAEDAPQTERFKCKTGDLQRTRIAPRPLS